MARIDKATIDRIHDATNIVDVVSDFVSLKKRGSSYLGLCPFHNERTPSFSVSASRGIFKCFSCGKAGSAISFLMDLESMSYVEALKWLGRKYNIEIQERELSSEEKEAEAVRESLFAANDFALGVFEKNLSETEEGISVGKAYFRERGISDAMISRFHLGYAIDQYDDLLNKARAAGFSDRYLIETGLEIKTDDGKIYDRFRGRVIYPIHSLSGRVVAFGGRTLRKEKTVSKYVNSPETPIYSKSNELYGMYQARNAIAKKKNCILVEGYMDVISMHQAGIENVVASSGTALTEGQIRMIHRFADSVTLIYDSDAAGIKASLRGINMLVAEGFDLKLVHLPEGEDPDSFAQSHSASEVEQYIAENSQNLIEFKTRILLEQAGSDPRARSVAITDILQTISLIRNTVEQSLYLEELSKSTGIASATLSAQLKSLVAANAEKDFKKRQVQEAEKTIADVVGPVREPDVSRGAVTPQKNTPDPVTRAEQELIRQVLRRGLLYLCDVFPDENATEPIPMSVIDYVESEMRVDGIEFSDSTFREIWDEALRLRDTEFGADSEAKEKELEQIRQQNHAAGLEHIRNTARDHAEILKLEQELNERIGREFDEAYDEFSESYIRNKMLRTDRRTIIDVVANLTSDPVVLSKMYPKTEPRQEALKQLPMAINILKSSLLKKQLDEILGRLADPSLPSSEIERLQNLYREKKERSMEFDKYNGEIVITPH